MNLTRQLARYFKGLFLAPIYIIRTHDFARIILKNQSPRNYLAEEHAAIYKDLERLGAVKRGDILEVNGIKVRIDPPRTIETVKEVMLTQDYAFSTHDKGHIMIDVGMNVGFASLLKANDPAFTRVYGFEPLKPTFDIAAGNITLNPSLASKIETFNYGLSNENQELTVKFAMGEIMSVSSEGTFDSIFPDGSVEEKIQVKKASDVLSPILQRHAGERIFLKLDCEGAEFKIIPDLEESGLLKKIHVLIVEWHHRSPDELLGILMRNGFFCFVQMKNIEWNVGFIRAVACT